MTDYQRRATDREMTEIEDSFRFCPRYDKHELSDEQIEVIAENAAKKAVELAKNDMYNGIGKTVVNYIFWIVGIASVGLFVLAVKMGWVGKP